jgi:hypothetical protein
MAVASESFKARIGPICDVEAYVSGRYRDAVRSAELARCIAFAPESQAIPDGPEALSSGDSCG